MRESAHRPRSWSPGGETRRGPLPAAPRAARARPGPPAAPAPGPRPGRSSAAQPRGGLLRMVGDDEVGARPGDRREHLQERPRLIEADALHRKLEHRVLDADALS